MSKAHERVVEAQFGPRAKAYVESAVHSQGADLEAIGALAQNAELALDMGAGGGHVSYALARHARRVIATICRPRCWRRSRGRRARRGCATSRP